MIIVGMHAVGPTGAGLHFHNPAGEVEPGLIEERAHRIGTGHPDEHWRVVGHCAETLFAFAQRRFHPFTLGDIADDHLDGWLALISERRGGHFALERVPVKPEESHFRVRHKRACLGRPDALVGQAAPVGVDELPNGAADQLVRMDCAEEARARRIDKGDLIARADEDGIGRKLDQPPVAVFALLQLRFGVAALGLTLFERGGHRVEGQPQLSDLILAIGQASAGVQVAVAHLLRSAHERLDRAQEKRTAAPPG